ncbi:MAG: cobalamin biosynthesis protein CobD [candidate division NC10 bacterium]|nr:cobalamin biosynthesis protein CobD [candidate division NC10 bacterium]
MSDAVRTVSVVALAIVLDLAFGDPPNRWHPVAWLGELLRTGSVQLMRGSQQQLLVSGAALTLSVAALGGATAWALSQGAVLLGVAGLLLEAVALKSLLSVRGLVAAARGVAQDLERGDLPAARGGVGFHLVSRPTAGLGGCHVASAAIESVAENLTDAFIGPLCFYLAFGLPGAAVYRAVNTADAMLGYRRDRLEYFGKLAARLDDLFNLVPARLAGCAVVLGAALAGERPRSAFAIMARDAGRTVSPNAGWTMAAMAGALGVSLEKPSAYRLGSGPLPTARDIERAIRVMLAGAALALAVGLILRLSVH